MQLWGQTFSCYITLPGALIFDCINRRFCLYTIEQMIYPGSKLISSVLIDKPMISAGMFRTDAASFPGNWSFSFAIKEAYTWNFRRIFGECST